MSARFCPMPFLVPDESGPGPVRKFEEPESVWFLAPELDAVDWTSGEQTQTVNQQEQ